MLAWIRTPRSMEELSLFARHLAGAMDAGIPMPEILKAFLCDTERSAMSRAVERMIPAVERGGKLSEAMDAEPHVFPLYVRQLVRIGERGGITGSLMHRTADVIDKSLETYEYTRRAAAYPLVLIIILSIVCTFTFVKLMPKFADIYSQLGSQLPPVTLFMSQHFLLVMCLFLMPGVFLLLCLLGLNFTGAEGGRYLLSLPWVGPVLRRAETARFCSTLGLLLEAGIPPAEALGLMRDAASNDYVRAAMAHFEEQYKRGGKLSALVAGQPLFPEGMAVMLAAAETQGRLSHALVRLGVHYEQRAQHGVAILREIMEPIMLLVIGLFLMMMAAAIYLPMFSIVKIIR